MPIVAQVESELDATEGKTHGSLVPLWQRRREDCLAAVARVLGSNAFQKAARLSSLLEYICRQELQGRGSEISEVALGVALFGRAEQYNTSDDNIVRSTVRLLRQRLDTFYTVEGADEPIQIEIPRGSYVPVFREKPAAVGITERVPEPVGLLAEHYAEAFRAASSALKESTPNQIKTWHAFAAGILVAVLVATLLYLCVSPGVLNRTRTARFWSMIFSQKQPTLLVPADTTLMLYERAAHKTVSLEDYITGNMDNGIEAVNPEARVLLDGLKSRRYTAVTSVSVAAELGRISGSSPSKLQVKFCRDLRLEDLKQPSVVILVGAEQNNPWLHLFRDRLTFHLDWDSNENRFHINNSHPMLGEPAEWSWTKKDTDHRGFGQIAFLRNLNGNGYVLIIAGTSMDGTQAALEFLLDQRRTESLLKQAEQKGRPFGGFEVLLQAKVLDHGSIGTTVLSERFFPLDPVP
jgi:hypothetical protein